MNSIEDQLERLFRAARLTAVAGTNPAAPYGLETRVLAAWRGAAEMSPWNMGLLVRGLILASAIMVVSLWPALSTTASSSPDSDYLQLADSSLPMDK